MTVARKGDFELQQDHPGMLHYDTAMFTFALYNVLVEFSSCKHANTAARQDDIAVSVSAYFSWK